MRKKFLLAVMVMSIGAVEAQDRKYQSPYAGIINQLDAWEKVEKDKRHPEVLTEAEKRLSSEIRDNEDGVKRAGERLQIKQAELTVTRSHLATIEENLVKPLKDASGELQGHPEKVEQLSEALEASNVSTMCKEEKNLKGQCEEIQRERATFENAANALARCESTAKTGGKWYKLGRGGKVCGEEAELVKKKIERLGKVSEKYLESVANELHEKEKDILFEQGVLTQKKAELQKEMVTVNDRKAKVAVQPELKVIAAQAVAEYNSGILDAKLLLLDTKQLENDAKAMGKDIGDATAALNAIVDQSVEKLDQTLLGKYVEKKIKELEEKVPAKEGFCGQVLACKESGVKTPDLGYDDGYPERTNLKSDIQSRPKHHIPPTSEE